MRISKSLGVAVVNVSVEVESHRHERLRRYCREHGVTANSLLRDKMISWIDSLPTKDSDHEES